MRGLPADVMALTIVSYFVVRVLQIVCVSLWQHHWLLSFVVAAGLQNCNPAKVAESSSVRIANVCK